MNIVLTGSLAFDRIMDFRGRFKDHILPDKIHTLNVAFNVERFEEKRGGTAGNIAYNLALLGEKPLIIASAGKDFTSYRSVLEGRGIDLTRVETHPDITSAAAYIITDLDDNQITGFFVGAMGRATNADLAEFKPQETIVMISVGNKSDMLGYSRQCKKYGLSYIFDPGQTLPFLTNEELEEMLTGCFMLINNDYELQMILNRLKKSEQEILDQVGYVNTTYGKDGSVIKVGDEKIRRTAEENLNFLVKNKEEEVKVPAVRPREVIDPTGAGDAYRAGLVKGLVAGRTLREIMQIATVAAVYAVEQYGTQEHSYTFAEFCERYEQSFSSKCPLKMQNAKSKIQSDNAKCKF